MQVLARFDPCGGSCIGPEEESNPPVWETGDSRSVTGWPDPFQSRQGAVTGRIESSQHKSGGQTLNCPVAQSAEPPALTRKVDDAASCPMAHTQGGAEQKMHSGRSRNPAAGTICHHARECKKTSARPFKPVLVGSSPTTGALSKDCDRVAQPPEARRRERRQYWFHCGSCHDAECAPRFFDALLHLAFQPPSPFLQP